MTSNSCCTGLVSLLETKALLPQRDVSVFSGTANRVIRRKQHIWRPSSECERSIPVSGPHYRSRGRVPVAFSATDIISEEGISVVSNTTIALLLAFGMFRAFVYFRMQYVIARMLGKYVPRGGSRVLDLDIHEGRNLYYYPADVAQVIALTDNKNYQVVKNQAIRAGIPVDLKLKTTNSLGLPSNSMDAVVSVYCLSGLEDRKTGPLLQEAIRLLKPGKPFIFVENVMAEEAFVRTCQTLLYKALKFIGVESTPVKDVSKVLQECEGLDNLEYETLFYIQDPHVVGLAMKKSVSKYKPTQKRQKKKL